MNNKIKAVGIIAILIALVGIQVIAAQQANDYRAYVSGQFIDRDQPYNGTNATMAMNVAYVPVYASPTYTLTVNPLYVYIDMAQPTKINDQIATAVKQQGDALGYNVIRVFIPSYEMKVV